MLNLPAPSDDKFRYLAWFAAGVALLVGVYFSPMYWEEGGDLVGLWLLPGLLLSVVALVWFTGAAVLETGRNSRSQSPAKQFARAVLGAGLGGALLLASQLLPLIWPGHAALFGAFLVPMLLVGTGLLIRAARRIQRLRA